MTKKLNYPFLFSLLGHLLLVINVTLVWSFRPVEEKQLMYLPAYLARPVTSGPTQKATMQETPSKESTPQQESLLQKNVEQKNPVKKNVPTSKLGIEKPASEASISASQPLMDQKKSVKRPKSKSTPEREEAQDLSKDKSVDRPLLKLLHDATAERLVYPKIAADFNQSGAVAVGFTVYPNGQITGARIVKSSGFDLLDQAALKAINEISPVSNVNQYIQKEEFVTAFIVFKLMGGTGTFAFE